MQEPYIDSYGNTRANHHWRVVYPSAHLANSSAKRSAILVNTRLDTNSWSQIRLENSNDISAIQINHSQGKTALFNIYNDCSNSDTMTALDSFLREERNSAYRNSTDSMLWCRDFNRHHPMWDEERNSHLFPANANRAAEELITLLADYHMIMALPRRLLTLQSMSTGNWTQVDNVFCSDNVSNTLTSCNTCPRLRGPGTDHVPILTVIDIHTPHVVSTLTRNFRMTDWKEFREQLTENLARRPPPKEIPNITDFQEAVSFLTITLQDTIEEVVPETKPVPHTKRWWNLDLSCMKKKKN